MTDPIYIDDIPLPKLYILDNYGNGPPIVSDASRWENKRISKRGWRRASVYDVVQAYHGRGRWAGTTLPGSARGWITHCKLVGALR